MCRMLFFSGSKGDGTRPRHRYCTPGTTLHASAGRVLPKQAGHGWGPRPPSGTPVHHVVPGLEDECVTWVWLTQGSP